jgi:hypothetical protein
MLIFIIYPSLSRVREKALIRYTWGYGAEIDLKWLKDFNPLPRFLRDI